MSDMKRASIGHNSNLEREYGQFLAQNYKPLDVTLSGAKDSWAWDADGTLYLDGLSCYGAVNFGHLNDKLVDVATRQLSIDQDLKDYLRFGDARPGAPIPDHIPHDTGRSPLSRNFQSETLDAFSEALCSLAGLDEMLPSSGGVEGVETAIKAVRRWGYDVKGIPDNKAKIIFADNCFHGRTTTVVSASSDPDAKRGFGPLTEGFLKVPYNDPEALAKLLMEQGDEIAGIIIEPVQGEAGVFVPDDGYLKKVQAQCKHHNIMFVLDEIQSGMGRTGKNFAFQHELDTPPDGLILAKALGGGIIPVSAFLGTKELMSVYNPGSHGSTFGGNPLASSVAHTVVDLMVHEDMAGKSAEHGEWLLAELQKHDEGFFKDIRGKGLWIGLELDTEARAKKFCKHMVKKHHILCKDAHATVRISPPFTSTREEIGFIAEAVHEVAKSIK